MHNIGGHRLCNPVTCPQIKVNVGNIPILELLNNLLDPSVQILNLK